MNVLWEAMIAEMRSVYADLANRRHFSEQGKPITDTRRFIDELTAPAPYVDPVVRVAQSATNLQAAADSGFIEVG